MTMIPEGSQEVISCMRLVTCMVSDLMNNLSCRVFCSCQPVFKGLGMHSYEKHLCIFYFVALTSFVRIVHTLNITKGIEFTLCVYTINYFHSLCYLNSVGYSYQIC